MQLESVVLVHKGRLALFTELLLKFNDLIFVQG